MTEPNPLVSISYPLETFIGEPFEATLEFRNQAPAVIGFLPAYDLILPIGVEFFPSITPTCTWNGTNWISGVNIITNYPNFPTTAIPVSGLSIGDSLYNVILPYSSYGPNQPVLQYPLDLIVTDPTYIVGNSYSITSYGIFFLGKDAVVNPNIDPTVFQIPSTIDVLNPLPLKLYKTQTVIPGGNAIPTGPNYPITYALRLHVAPNQTINEAIINDTLDSALRYISPLVSSSSPLTLSANPFPGINEFIAPNNISGPQEFIFNLGSITGTPITGTDYIIEYM
ncbi:MAG: hypothetical protein WD512_04810, partial [Candidatus Paceibacterota bacterium]